MKRNLMIGDTSNLALAVWLFFSPWIVGFADHMPAAWTAWLTAIAIGAFAIAALMAFAEWEEWINLVLGLWAVVSPWVVGFATDQPPTVVMFLTGLVVAAIAAIELWLFHRQPPRITTA
jgi:SPW repeat